MTELILLLNVLLLTRMVYLRSDEWLGMLANLALSITQLAALFLLFSSGRTTLWLGALIAATGVVSLLIDVLAARRRLDLAEGWRALPLLLLLLGSGAIVNSTGPLTASWLLVALEELSASLLPLLPDGSALPLLNHVVFGLLLLANETNILIRATFHHLRLEPQLGTTRQPDPRLVRIDEAEYQAGRAIGILERWLMFLVVFSQNDLTAIGFIIAVKGLVRYKRIENDRKDRFAEYLLVGTMLSTLFAIIVAQWIRALA